MLNTLIHNQPVNKGLQWGIYIATDDDVYVAKGSSEPLLLTR